MRPSCGRTALRLHQRLGNRAAVDGDERRQRRACPRCAERARDELLARAGALAGDEGRSCFVEVDLRDQLEHLLHRAGSCRADPRSRARPATALAQLDVSRSTQRASSRERDRRRRSPRRHWKRLGQVVVRAGLHRGERGLGARERGDEDDLGVDRGVGADGSHRTSRSRGSLRPSRSPLIAQVGDDDVERRGPELGERRPRRCLAAVTWWPGAAQADREELAHGAFVVVDDEDLAHARNYGTHGAMMALCANASRSVLFDRGGLIGLVDAGGLWRARVAAPRRRRQRGARDARPHWRHRAPVGLPGVRAVALRAWSWLPGSPAHAAARATGACSARSRSFRARETRAARGGRARSRRTSPSPSSAARRSCCACTTEAEVFAMNDLACALVLWLAARGGPARGVARGALARPGRGASGSQII